MIHQLNQQSAMEILINLQSLFIIKLMIDRFNFFYFFELIEKLFKLQIIIYAKNFIIATII